MNCVRWAGRERYGLEALGADDAFAGGLATFLDGGGYLLADALLTGGGQLFVLGGTLAGDAYLGNGWLNFVRAPDEVGSPSLRSNLAPLLGLGQLCANPRLAEKHTSRHWFFAMPTHVLKPRP